MDVMVIVFVLLLFGVRAFAYVHVCLCFF